MNLLDYRVRLTTLLNEDGTSTSSRQKMELITKRFYTDLFHSSVSVSNLVILTGEIPPRILLAEVRAAIQTMKAATAPGRTMFRSTSYEL
ncbi:unnamed protein product [Strongylus vulgaris]|uniref:Uncharacterized protein n=1 Tax=Strongylus vulgaris TaxID=40348 RepID=A0A3P7KM84_STRVU|nr:unnamed protein product [Strongylus vulgaris]